MSDRAVGGTLRARRGAARRDATAATRPPRDADDASTRLPDDDVSRRRRNESTTTRRRPFFRTLARVARLARPYFFGDSRWCARGLLFAVVALCGLTTSLMVVFSDCQKDMSTALAEKNAPGFYAATRAYVFVIAVAAPLFATYAFAQNTLALEWRVWLTKSLMERYFRNEVFYALARSGGTEDRGREFAESAHDSGKEKRKEPPFPKAVDVDTPERSLCLDSARFTETCAGLVTTVAQKVLSLCAFLNVLYQISPALVATCFLYGFAGALLVSKSFASRLTDADTKCAMTNADLRTLLTRVRDKAESVAFCRGGARELKNALTSLTAVADATKSKIAASFGARLFADAFEFALVAVPSLVVAPRYFRGEVPFGAVTQAGFAFRTVSNALNVVVARFEELTALAAETERLDALEEAFAYHANNFTRNTRAYANESPSFAFSAEVSNGPKTPSDDGTSGGNDGNDAGNDSVVLRLANVSARVPNARNSALWSGLNLTAKRGDAVLISGPSGCGKSALFRVAAGLWDPAPDGAHEVEMVLPPRASTMFLPQETYVCGGEATLRDLVRYPGASFDDDDETSDETNDDDVRDALNAAGLQRLLLLDDADWVTDGRSAFSHPSQGARSVFQNQKIIDALDVKRDWTACLSPGERQRVAFARLFLRRPSLAFLDEATSFLDETAEAEMYALVKKRAGCVVSVGHRSSLRKFHDAKVEYVPAPPNESASGGTWETRRAA